MKTLPRKNNDKNPASAQQENAAFELTYLRIPALCLLVAHKFSRTSRMRRPKNARQLIMQTSERTANPSQALWVSPAVECQHALPKVGGNKPEHNKTNKNKKTPTKIQRKHQRERLALTVQLSAPTSPMRNLGNGQMPNQSHAHAHAQSKWQSQSQVPTKLQSMAIHHSTTHPHSTQNSALPTNPNVPASQARVHTLALQPHPTDSTSMCLEKGIKF